MPASPLEMVETSGVTPSRHRTDDDARGTVKARAVLRRRALRGTTAAGDAFITVYLLWIGDYQ